MIFESQSMDPCQKVTSMVRPPYFKGENYLHWKVRMQYLLKMQSENVWKPLNSGRPPKVLDREGTR